MKSFPHYLILVFLVVAVSGSGLISARADKGTVREFTSNDGRKMKAVLVSVDGERVTIRRSDGKLLTASVSKFSVSDQEFFKAWKPAREETVSGASNDWYQWRGPGRDGVSKERGLNTDWDAKEPELLWRSKGFGSGMASIAISKGKIFTLGKRRSTVMHCRDLKDGSEIWQAEISGKGDPNCTPTVDFDSGLVFGLSKDGELSAVRVADGSVAWTLSFTSDLGGKMMSGWGYSESPLVDGNYLICTPGASDGLLVALDKKSGKVIWKTDVTGADLGSAGKDGAGYGSVVISQGGGIKQYVQIVGRGLVGVAADDGRLLWSYNRIANGTANIPTPVISGDYVFGSTGYGDGGSALLKLSKSGKGVAAKEEYHYRAKELQNHHGGMILIDGHVYLGDGHNNGFPQCIELKTGKIKWESRVRGAGSQSAAITYADGHLFFRYQNAVMALVEANPEGYKVKGSFKIAAKNGNSWPHPVIQNGKLYLRDQDELLCYNLK